MSLLPPFWKFSIRYIEQWAKNFCKKTGRPGRSEVGRPAAQPAMILKFTGRVEKILTGSISVTACNSENQWYILAFGQFSYL